MSDKPCAQVILGVRKKKYIFYFSLQNPTDNMVYS